MRDLTIAAKAALQDISKELMPLITDHERAMCEYWYVMPNRLNTKRTRRLNRELFKTN